MKICILTHTFPRFDEDIAAPFMDGVASGMVKNDNNVFVLAPFSPRFARGAKKKKYKLLTYKYAPFNSWHKLGYSETLTDDKSLKLSGYLLSPLMFICGIISLYRLVKKEKIDIINAHWILPNGFIASIVSVLTGVPVVSTLPGSDVYMVQKNFLFKWMGRFAARTAKAITSNSPQLIEDLKGLTGVNENKFFPIVYGVNPRKFKPTRRNLEKIRRKLKVKKEQKVVLGVGRLVAKKGFRYLVEAASSILKKHPNTVFVVIGEGEQKKILEELSVKLKVARNFRFLGKINYKDLVSYYNFADVFILPSIRDEEGNLDDQSVSVVEAMACGKPIVTTDFPGYRIVVENGRNGFLVKEKRSDLIVRALNDIFISKTKMVLMSKRSRYLVVNNLTWQVIGSQYTNLFKKLLNNE